MKFIHNLFGPFIMENERRLLSMHNKAYVSITTDLGGMAMFDGACMHKNERSTQL